MKDEPAREKPVRRMPLPVSGPAGCPMHPPVEFAALRHRPIERVALADGSDAWLLTRYPDVKAVLSDDRFSASPATPGYPASGSSGGAGPSVVRMMMRRDPPDHTRLRRMVAGDFMPRRIERLRPRIRELITELLDAMARHGAPADFVAAFADPLPTRLICELLGVPHEDHDFFKQEVSIVASQVSTADEQVAAQGRLDDYILGLAKEKARVPDGSILSKLADYQRKGELTEAELASFGVQILGAGTDTTSGMLALSIISLLTTPGLVAELGTTPDRWPSIVEELLRFHSVARGGPRRVALSDVRVGDCLIRRGEAVIASAWAGNHDEKQFADPGGVVVRDPAPKHLAFGWGIHQCLGQSLARAEMSMALPAIFERFPSLAIEADVGHIEFRCDAVNFGVKSLWVKW